METRCSYTAKRKILAGLLRTASRISEKYCQAIYVPIAFEVQEVQRQDAVHPPAERSYEVFRSLVRCQAGLTE